MPRIGTGLGLGLFQGGSGGIDAQAQAHYNRVIADGGVVPAGLSGVNAFFTAVKTIYGTSDITTAVGVGLDAQYLGYKLGAGAGATSGQAVQKLYSCAGSSGDVVQTTAASQPLLLVHSGANYWFGSGVSNNYVSTPNAAANQITLDIDICAYIDYKTNGTYQVILSKSSATFAYSFYINNDRLEIEIGNPQTGVPSSASLGSSFVGWVRVTRVKTSGLVRFYTSSDSVSTSINSINWTQNGTDQSLLPNVAINNNSNNLFIGTYGDGTFLPFNGKIYRTAISNSIGGTPVVDFNPATYNASTSQTQWTSTTGEVWTINTGTATTGYKGVLVNRTIMQGDGISAYMEQNGSLGFALNSANSFYFATRKFTTSNQFPFEYRKSSAGNGILARIGNGFANYREGQAYQATSFTNNTLLNLFNSVFQANVNRSVSVNNATPQTDATAGTLSSDIVDNIGLFGFGSGSGANYNGTINNFIITKLADTTIEQTAMYDYIRSINNNAF
jgi:hypothetical protein